MALPVDPLPTKPSSGTLADAAEVKSKFDAIYAYITGGQMEADFIKAGSGLYDSYRHLLQDKGQLEIGNVGATPVWFSPEPVSSGTSPSTPNVLPNVLYLAAANFAITGKTSKLNLRASIFTNAAVALGAQ